MYYAGDRFDVALAETAFHFERFMAATDEEPATADYRELVSRIDADLHDRARWCGIGAYRLRQRFSAGRLNLGDGGGTVGEWSTQTSRVGTPGATGSR